MERNLFTICIIMGVYGLVTNGATIDHNAKAKDVLSDDKHEEKGEHNSNYDHEAFVGVDEAKKYDQLTPEESKKRLSKFIPVIDKDADKFLEEDELKTHIKFMQKRYTLKDVERTWQNYDQSKMINGEKLPWEVYRDAVYGVETDKQISSEYEEMLEKDRRRWKLADTLVDDTLDKDEYLCFMHPETCDHMRDIIVKETIEDIDKNKDGFVDLEEYIGDMYRPEDYPNQKTEPDWVKSEREMFLLYRDTNKDGKLDLAEMREWIAPNGFDHAEAESKHLINLADDNKDGKLSIEEILAHYDVFVGSQATDYGEQLQKHDPAEL